jgi:hypothetical protein
VTIPVAVGCPARPRRPGRTVSPLADAGHRGGNAPGPTVPYWIRQRARTRPWPGQCDSRRHLFCYDAWLTRSSSSSSARFPSVRLRSRDRSPPCHGPPVGPSCQSNAGAPADHPDSVSDRESCRSRAARTSSTCASAHALTCSRASCRPARAGVAGSPPVAGVYPLDGVTAAHERRAAGGAGGSLVLLP